MLALGNRTFKIFEPFRRIRNSDSALEDWTEEEVAGMVPMLEKVLDCDQARRQEGTCPATTFIFIGA